MFIILQIFFAACTVLKSGEYSWRFLNFSWGILCHVTGLDESHAGKNIWWIINSNIRWNCGTLCSKSLRSQGIIDTLDWTLIGSQTRSTLHDTWLTLHRHLSWLSVKNWLTINQLLIKNLLIECQLSINQGIDRVSIGRCQLRINLDFGDAFSTHDPNCVVS